MSRTVLVDRTDENDLWVRFPGRTWELAHDVIAELKENPPEGYRMVESTVKPRAMFKSGRRCNVALLFLHIDDRIIPLTTGGAKAYFEPYMLQAQGVEE
jgi:hypothetical protein